MSSDSSTIIASGIELVPGDYLGLLDFEAIYGRNAPLEVDLGCGDGSFLATIASENPEKNYLGIERLKGRVRTACRKIERAGITNARIVRFEISSAVTHLLPSNSVTAFYLLFPDPWPKRRHAPRRLVTEKFLGAIHAALVPNGILHIATDESDYFRQISQVASRFPQLSITPTASSFAATTKFERRFTQAGVPIHRLSLRKISPVRKDLASQ